MRSSALLVLTLRSPLCWAASPMRPLFAVPTSIGYGITQGGETALRSMLASCAPGVAVLNIDNGYGAACAAARVLAALYPQAPSETAR